MTEYEPVHVHPPIGVHREGPDTELTEPESRNAPVPISREDPVVGPPPRRLAVAELRRDIEQTREELGETLQALAAKADIKERVRRGLRQARSGTAQRIAGAARPVREAAAAVAREARGRPAALAVIGAGAVVAAAGALAALQGTLHAAPQRTGTRPATGRRRGR